VIHIGAIEAVYIGLNLVTLGLTSYAAREAYRDRTAVREMNGPLREIAVSGAVRRERFRVVNQGALLALAVPSAFSAQPVQLSPFVAILMAISVLLLVSSYMDLAERRRMFDLAARESR
jgi:hypothetical protein